MSKKVLLHALLDALITAVYIVGVSFFIFNLEEIFSLIEGDSVFAPMVMLLTFVVSAAITGFSVFGKPIMWYLDGKKKEALSLLVWTLGFLLVTTLLIFLFVFSFA